jgi:hypothetical protein
MGGGKKWKKSKDMLHLDLAPCKWLVDRADLSDRAAIGWEGIFDDVVSRVVIDLLSDRKRVCRCLQ